MTYLVVAAAAFGFVCALGAIDWLLGLRYGDDMAPLPNGRFVVIQGRNIYHCDTEAEAAEMALRYAGVTRVEWRVR